MKTYSAKPSEVVRKWYVIDASQAPLGRVATQIATLLTGKGKPMFTHHIDCGDFVVVINAASVVVTGDKMKDKMYYSYSGFPGGLRERTMTEQMQKDPLLVIEKSVKGMLPVNKLRPARLARLKIYAGADHNHEAQKPELLDLKKGAK
ncbi:50S ribosomal protein L13 [bacterium]|nr:50S ribosomal protein L13 [bacterium]NBX98358.1 50S ribosomal protein L13 [bacterium]NDC93738.1 50S ribosomal protein L13 [bacterium]NDD82879.1 50S ribosomal protein L13 [bacterium]NDG28674.1 50S ribosomal protein L13 [bacterium]